MQVLRLIQKVSLIEELGILFRNIYLQKMASSMKLKCISLLILFFICTSCAKNLYVSYLPNSGSSGAVVLKPTTTTNQTFITVNDKLLVDKQNVKSVRIADLPEGEYKMMLSQT